jgi:hypothetical protein
MMRSLSRWLLPIGLATASLIGTLETASAQPAVRDHRGPRPPRDRGQADVGPREAPPPIREERVKPRGRGWVWIQGHWDWRGGRWEWTGGRWEKTRRGSKWRPLAWELRNGVYVRVDGGWIDDRPNAAPPPWREEKFEPRRGFTWVPGDWEWENGQWVWVEGRWERERRGKKWRRSKWENRDGGWMRVDGGWDDDVVAYPTTAPPALRDERPGTKAGFMWIRGHYEWRDGQYTWINGHWERERAKERWTDGRWELRNGRYEWIPGGWGAGPTCGAEPALSQPPPHAMKPETIAETPGKFEVKGRWNWDRTRCDYVWSSGYLESYRPGYRYVPGNWNQGNGKWYWVEARWERDGGAQPPPPHTTPPPPPPRPSGPTQPPPPPKQETYDKRAGFLWVRGHYEWRGSQYEWIPGHWERERAKEKWVDGRWELQGGVYVWVPGGWR